MIRALFGTGTVYNTLREGLSNDLRGMRVTADRIANAANGNAATATQGGLQGDQGQGDINLEEELAKVADTTLRYDAETRLLREAYTRLRTAIGSRG